MHKAEKVALSIAAVISIVVIVVFSALFTKSDVNHSDEFSKAVFQHVQEGDIGSLLMLVPSERKSEEILKSYLNRASKSDLDDYYVSAIEFIKNATKAELYSMFGVYSHKDALDNFEENSFIYWVQRLSSPNRILSGMNRLLTKLGEYEIPLSDMVYEKYVTLPGCYDGYESINCSMVIRMYVGEDLDRLKVGYLVHNGVYYLNSIRYIPQ